MQMLQDTFGRRFSYLRLSITDVCNFSCTYCLPDGYQCDAPRNFLTLPEINTVTAAFVGLGTQKIRITGGEPSLRKDLPDIIAAVAANQGVEKVAITTNGFKLPQHIHRWVDAGLTSLNVSIDSLDPRLFSSITGHDKLNTILKGVNLALETPISVKINAVLMEQVQGAGLQMFLNWIKDKPIVVRFIELMQTGDNTPFFQHSHQSGQQLKQQLLDTGWTKVTTDQTAGPAQEFQHPDYVGRIGLIMPYSKGFCDTCNRLRISSKGKLHLCLFAEQGIDLRSYMTAGDTEGLQQALVANLQTKTVSHDLHQGNTGVTQHLAMLGG